MDKKTCDKIKAHCAGEFPKEGGGFIIGGDFVPFANSSSDPTRFYEIDPREYSGIVSDVQALVHSHTTSDYKKWKGGFCHYPSGDDLRTQIAWGKPSHIFPILKYGGKFYFSGVVTVGDAKNIPDLWKRPFRFGSTDCWGFVRDWLTVNQGKTPPDFVRSWDFWSEGKNAGIEFSNEECFREVGEKDLKAGDILLIKLPHLNIAQHSAVYIGDNLMAHHLGTNKPYDSMSKPSKAFYSRWKKYVVKIVRFQDMFLNGIPLVRHAGGGGDAPEAKPTPQEEALADVAVKEYQDFAEYYMPFERQYQDYVKSLKSPYLMKQNQLRAETPYLQRFSGAGVSPGALEPRLMQHQMELGLKKNTARQMAIPDHFNNYTRGALEIASLGRNLEITTNRAQLGQARNRTQYELAKRHADSIRSNARYELLGFGGGLALNYFL